VNCLGVQGATCSVEWQKRGLPHIHILLWLENKITPDQIDDVISVEIPNPEEDPVLHDIVKRHMIHGPCGNVKMKSTCMSEGNCSKRYPRPLISDTQVTMVTPSTDEDPQVTAAFL
jgi:hypothetical protein